MTSARKGGCAAESPAAPRRAVMPAGARRPAGEAGSCSRPPPRLPERRSGALYVRSGDPGGAAVARLRAVVHVVVEFLNRRLLGLYVLGVQVPD